MNNQIKEWALNHFYEAKEVSFSSELEPWEIDELLAKSSFEGSSWSYQDIRVTGVKSYDEDGNSFWIGILIVSSEGKKVSDFLDLALILESIGWIDY